MSLHAANIHPDAGSTSAAFLKIPVGARASALAGAFTASADDLYASFYNPAGLAYLDGKTLSFSHNEYISGLRQAYLVYGLNGGDIGFLKSKPSLSRGSWAVSANYFFTGKDFERRSGLNEADPLYPISAVEGKFSAWDLALGVHYGYTLDSYTALGASLKFVTQKIDDFGGYSLALDLGAMKKFEMFDEVFSGALSVQNLGPGIKFEEKRYGLPLLVRGGLAYRVLESGTLVTLDALKYVDNYPYFALGLEHPLSGRLFLRTGYRYRVYGNELGAWSGFSAGMGLSYQRFSFDYSFNPYGDLGYSHRIGLTFKFLPKKRAELLPARQALPAGERMTETRSLAYNVNSTVTKLTPYYGEYEVTGESAEGFLPRIVFKSRARSQASDLLSVFSGKLPPEQEKKAGLGAVYAAFQISYGGAMSGSPKMELKIEKNWLQSSGKKGSDLELLYLDKEGFKRADLLPEKEDELFLYYSARPPQSPRYVLGTR